MSSQDTVCAQKYKEEQKCMKKEEKNRAHCVADAFPTHNSVDYECSKYLCLGAFIFWPKKRQCPAAACAIQCAFWLCECQAEHSKFLC